MSDVIRTFDLTKHFRGTLALNSLNLEIPEGAVYALVGPNGAGKTTALKVLMNIHRPSSGRAEILGTDSRRLAPRDFARIGYVSENQDLPEWMTVAQFLDYLRPFYPTWDDERCAELLVQLDLPRHHKLKHLSRGMRMKAALASSLAYRPKIILLDEPFSGLDALMRDELVESLLAGAGEATVLISSHDLSEIESFASHVGYLDQGHLYFSEELTTLTARFREVEVTLDAVPARRGDCPASWLRLESAASVVRFVESRFDTERTPAEVRRVFGQVAGVAFTPMPLRAIFVALAKSARQAA